MKKHLCIRILCLVLSAVMVLGMVPSVNAGQTELRWKKSDVEISWDRSDRLTRDEIHGMTAHKPTDLVRVSIVLEDAPTLKAGYSTNGIGTNAAAMAHDLQLQKAQKDLAKTISLQALDGKELDVVWNLTLASNIISANVPYGKIEAVKAVAGVADVVLERQYTLSDEDRVAPNTYNSGGMIGSTAVWQSGMTGAGTRVAIIDTGTDTDHQSFDNGAYLYALKQNAAAEGMSYEKYASSLDLLDAAEIAGVLKHLNAYERVGVDAAEDYYINEKLPFGANYVDRNLTVNHDWDNQGSHGSHVAGISTANRYIRMNGSYVGARETVRMCGVAPDAQLITMKVFGYSAGPYDSDYFAAIEDALWLGCDSVNLSLGSGSPGFSQNHLFKELLDYMATTDTVVVMSAGNSGYWAQQTAPGYLYDDGISFHTSGIPGTYTNSLSVASVDNDGTVGKYISVGGQMIVYTETEYRNRPMSSLDTTGKGTDYEYIFIDGVGRPEDYTGIDLEGKIVFCARGDSAFYEKANTAVNLGAAAVVVCNNETGVLSMNLNGYSYTAPCVSILMTHAKLVRDASVKRTTAAGLSYYTGTVTVSSGLGAGSYYSDYYTMSEFSSWGIPGSLEMKPEITAPGGMIWSVNGVDSSGTAYEMMSGTSMAAPQVTGMAALLSEYIRANKLEEKTGLSARQLAQSLLMSTAVPMRDGESDGEYFSILNQGAGLGRVDLATTAESYILVDGMDDGKVKVELGEDADREGVYTFSFSIHNLSGEAMTYKLSADLFTQDLFDGGDGNMYLDTWTRPLGSRVDFSMNGRSLENTVGNFACDLNGDGVTTAADADLLLEYLLGNEKTLKAGGDVDRDGSVDTYDAYVLLSKLSGEHTVDVPADGSVTIDVTMKLTEEAKTYLDSAYPTGAYVEGYVYAEPVTDGEGVLAVTHSIPVLGYYGSWSEPSMYDVGSYLEYTYGSETRQPYLYQINDTHSNYFTVNYGDGQEYLFGGNPITQEDAYLPERNAFNNKSGAMLQNLRFTQIRNAGNSKLLLKNAETGEVYLDEVLGQVESAYYHTNAGAWQNTQYKIGIGLNFAGFAEGTRLELSLISAPELYCTYDDKGTVTTDWDKVTEGGWLTTSLTIDNTAPVLKKVAVDDNSCLKITAKDNEYIAAVALMNATGTSVMTAAPVNQTKRGAEMVCELDLSRVFGEKFMVAVFDYAENVAVYEISLKLDNQRPYFTALDLTHRNDDQSVSYVGLYSDGTAVKLAPATDRKTAQAAEYAEGAVFEITEDDKIYASMDDDLYSFTCLGELDPDDKYWITTFNDLAYNKADGKLYGCFYSEMNNIDMPYLCTIDMFSGKMTVLGEMPIDANTMAIDGSGNFYSTTYASSKLYTYTADVTKTGKTTFIGYTDGYKSTVINSMAWDHNTDELYWAVSNGQTTNLVKVDPRNAKTAYINSFDFHACGLYIAYEPESDIFAPVDTVRAVTMPEFASTLVNNSVKLRAQVHPWNVSDNSVIWTSSNTKVAVVDDSGVVRGINEGTAVITAASVLDPSRKASCTVTVESLGKELKAVIWDEDGAVWWSSFDTAKIPNYNKLAKAENDLPVNSTMVADGRLYASTLDTTSGGSDLYTVDPKTFEMTLVGGSDALGFLDMAYSPSLGYGLVVYFNYIALLDLETGDYVGAWDWAEGSTASLVGITYYGSTYNTKYNTYMDYYLILDSDGNVYMDAFISVNGEIGYFNGPKYSLRKNLGKPVDYDYFQGFYFDGDYVYWTRFTEEDNIVELIVWDSEGNDNVYSLGYFPEGVWPVGGLYTDAGLNGSMALVDEEMTAASIKPAELLTSVELMELSGDVKGSVNAVNTRKPVKPMSKSQINKKGDVDVTVTMPAEGTNGMMTLKYDTAKMQLTGVFGKTEAFAWKLVKPGEVKIAFADRQLLCKDAASCVLRFEAMTYGDTTVKAAYTELGSGSTAMTEEIKVKLPYVNPFTDVPMGSFYHDPVLWAVKKGITTGATATTFNPNGVCQRAAVVTFLWRAAGEPEPASKQNPFRDVREKDFFYKAVLWAVEKGITNGMTATTFGPYEECNRAQVVTFLYRAMEKPAYSANKSGFSDVTNKNAFYYAPVLWAVENGITNGMGDGTFGVEETCNRAQVVTFLYRTMAD